MRALVAIGTLGTLGTLAACSDPTFDVHITYETLASVPDDQQLARHVATLVVSVVDAEAAGAAAGLDDDAKCIDVALGRVPEAVLEGARRASVGALDTPRLSGVPRLGAKLVIAEARDAAGRRAGAGCNDEYADIEDNTTVPVTVEIAPRVRVFTRELVGAMPTPARLVVTSPWNDLLPLPRREVLAELHASSGRVGVWEGETNDNGLVETGRLDLREAGPAQTVIRVRWADEPLRIPAFAPWPPMEINGAPRFTLASDDGSRLSRSWVSGPATIGTVTSWSAAALQMNAQNEEQLLVVRYNAQLERVGTFTADVPGTRAIALWQRGLYTVTTGGWNKIENGVLQPQSGDAPGVGPASELHSFEGCGSAPGAGFLVRRSNGTSEQWYAYDGPARSAASDSLLGRIAADSMTEAIVGQACVKLDGQDVRVIATRGLELGLRAWLSTGGLPLSLTAVQNATAFSTPDAAFVAAVEATIAGPRVMSYKLTNLPILSNILTGFVAVDGVDTELATLPLSFAVDDVDADNAMDVLAVLPGASGPRIQANFGRLVAGEQLASVSPALDGARAATNPVLRLEDVNADGDKELVLMTDEGIDILCFDVRGGPGGTMVCDPN